MEQGFGKYHPAVNFIFFAGAALFGMFFVHPAFLLLSLCFALSYYFLLRGKSGLRFFWGMMILFAVISLLNPVFNPYGETVLFTYFWGRPFTLEALGYGFATGGMFLVVILWFACYNEIMTSDKFTYLFGRVIPSISMVLCMVLRFVPNLKAKAEMIGNARKCIGKAPENAEKKEKLASSMTVLSVLTSWALEGAAITADSMKSRGYGLGPRTNFSVYRASLRDGLLCFLMLACIGATVVCALLGGMEVVYMPVLYLPQAGPATICGFICYGIFLAIPVAINIWEEVTWRILRSKI